MRQISKLQCLAFFCVALENILNVRSNIVCRYGNFQELSGILMANDFIIREIPRIHPIKCAKKCMIDKTCMSFAHGVRKCVLYSSDPRIHFNENALIRTDSPSSLKLMIVSTQNDDVPCEINNLKAYTSNHFAVCGIDQKRTDAICEWSDRETIYFSPCGNLAKISKFRYYFTSFVLRVKLQINN